jgi:hypothetical protein
MEKKNLKLKNNFTQLISQISKLYKDVSTAENEEYNKGKKEAYEEILSWFLSTHNQEYKYISSNGLFQILQEKLTKVRSSINDQEDWINLTDIKVSDNRKRIRNNNDIDNLILDEPVFTNNSNLFLNTNQNYSELSNNPFIPQNTRKKKFK